MKKSKLSASITDFRTMILEGWYYIDKTAWIKDIVTEHSRVLQITRPHGFGKSLGLSTLYYFLTGCIQGKDLKGQTEEHSRLFSGLAVSEDDFFCSEYMGQYPVIHISFSHASFNSFELTHSVLCSTIVNLAKSFSFLSSSTNLDLDERVKYEHLTDYYHLVNHYTDLSLSIYDLTRLLSAHYEKPVYLLIDDIDTPLSAASKFGYYGEMSDLITHMIIPAVNQNNYLSKAIIVSYLPLTASMNLHGCHISEVTDTAPALNNFFGFDKNETLKIISDFKIDVNDELIEKWYGGYGGTDTQKFNASSIVSFCADNLDSGAHGLICTNPYWMEQNRNHNFYEFLSLMQSADTAELKKLLKGDESQISDGAWVTYQDLKTKGACGYWNYLYASGYFTADRTANHMQNTMKIRIPNNEVKDYILNQIKIFFSARNEIFCKNARYLLSTLTEGDYSKVENSMNWCLKTYISTDESSALDEYSRFINEHLMIYYESSLSYLSGMDPKFASEKSWIACIYNSDQYSSDQIGIMMYLDVCGPKEDAEEKVEKILKEKADCFSSEPFRNRKFKKSLVYALVFHDRSCTCRAIELQKMEEAE